MATPLLKRVETMKVQLNQVSEEYLAIKERFDEARVTYEVAREKFASVRRLALNVLSSQDWWTWRSQHKSVQYTGLKLGEAIANLLENHAYDVAANYWTAVARKEKKAEYLPMMGLERIQETLEHGGFEFRTSTPLREVNAALINAPEVEKDRDLFSAARAKEILAEMEWVREFEEQQMAKEAAKKTAPKEQAKKADDDPPW